MRRARFDYDYDDYAHLARVAEWSVADGEERGGHRHEPTQRRGRHRPHAPRPGSTPPTRRASAWVSANAGTGKTHVLTQRVLRLLLAGTTPERILCLTYTKAAAAEMSKRVFDTPGAVGDAARRRELAQQLGELLRPRAARRRGASCARTLFAVAIETPGGLKVQTIHAFCERLLQRFPLEAGVPPGFAILDDETARALLREAIDATLTGGDDGASPSRARPGARSRRSATRPSDSFDEVLRDALGRRATGSTAPRASTSASARTSLPAARPLYRRAFGFATTPIGRR